MCGVLGNISQIKSPAILAETVKCIEEVWKKLNEVSSLGTHSVITVILKDLLVLDICCSVCQLNSLHLSGSYIHHQLIYYHNIITQLGLAPSVCVHVVSKQFV